MPVGCMQPMPSRKRRRRVGAWNHGHARLFEAVAEEFTGDAESAGGGGDVLIGFAKGVGDELVDHLVEDETLLGQAPGGIAPGGGRGGRGAAGEVSEVEVGVGREDDGAFDFVRELADVPGPRLSEEARFACGGDREIFKAMARGDLGEKVAGEVKEIGAAFAEWRER